MLSNLLTHPKFHADFAGALKVITVAEVSVLNKKINSNLVDLPDEIIVLVKDSELFKKFLVLTYEAFVSNDLQVANGVKQFFFEMAERRIEFQK